MNMLIWPTSNSRQPARASNIQTGREVNMQIVVPAETEENERRVGLTPESVKKLVRLGFRVSVEDGIGEKAGYSNDEYSEAGSDISTDRDKLLSEGDIIARVRKPSIDEISKFKTGSMHVSYLDPYNESDLVDRLAQQGVTAISMEMIPRTTRAQKMEALSSQANLAGYAAVIESAKHLSTALPMMMTAAGTLKPARVFVIGVGVAGLQAIATAKRLGARVDAFDTRDVVEEQVQSLGAKFVKINLGETGQTDQGYAKELTPEQVQKQKDLQADVCARSDIVITTAQLFGRPAPKLIDTATIEKMKPGSVIFDMAVESGGNVEGSVADELVIKNGVKIIGISNLASSVSNHASLALSNNFNHWITDFFNKEESSINFDFDDEIIKSSVIVFNSKILNERFQ